MSLLMLGGARGLVLGCSAGCCQTASSMAGVKTMLATEVFLLSPYLFATTPPSMLPQTQSSDFRRKRRYVLVVEGGCWVELLSSHFGGWRWSSSGEGDETDKSRVGTRPDDDMSRDEECALEC